ncbi:MAG: hypothetical protein P8Y25_08880, partial [Chromatiaceae bacterium]
MTTYIQDLIDLPEKVHGGDFVLKLTEGVEHPDETLRPYVVTPELARNFDDALDFIKGAIQSSSSKAAYLHGSFGSGKSHFMAVLHLLLQQHPAAKAKDGLAAVITKHNAWLEGKRFLLVPYHMIGQPSMEAAVLGGYVKRVLELHPKAPIPGVYRAAGLFRDAAELRKTMGNAAFFERLNRSAAGGGGGWGEPARPHPDLFAQEIAPVSKDRAQVLRELTRMKPLAFHAWLEEERAIPRSLLLDPRFAGRIKVDFRANAVFPHADQDGPCGYEIKNRGFTGFAPAAPERGGTPADRARLARDRAYPRRGNGHPPHAQARPRGVPQGLSLQPRPGGDPDRRLLRAAARAY